MPRTTLASRILTPIQPSPRKHASTRAPATMRGRSSAEVVTSRRVSPPVACASGRQHFGGRRHLGEFLRVRRADIDQRLQRAVGRLPQAQFIGTGTDARHRPGSAGRQRQLRASCRRARSPSPAARSSPMVWRYHDEIAALRDQAQRFLVEVGLLHQPVRQAAQQIDMRPAAFDSRAPTARYDRTAAARRGLRPGAPAPASACRRRLPSRRSRWCCAYRRGGRSGSTAAARWRSLQARASPGGACRSRSGCARNAFSVTPTGSAGKIVSSGVRQMLVVLA